MLRDLSGSVLAGEALGVSSDVRLPAFTKFERYLSDDGQVEIDALAGNDETWALEVRWRLGAASRADLERFSAKDAGVSISRRWFISRGGFRPDALEYAAAEGMDTTDGEGYSRLRQQVG